jgi:curved DNA-binding protein
MDFKDYYAILGVTDSADAAEIKSSYRKLARKYHPDVNKEKDSEEKFKELGEAYEVLKDPEKRAEYDQLRKYGAAGADGSFRPPPGWQSAADFSSGGYTGAGTQNFSDFFESIFGARGGANAHYAEDSGANFRRRGEDVQYTVSIFLEEAHQGVQRQIKLSIPDAGAYGRSTTREKTLNVKIPAGVVQGQRIRLAGQGAPGIGGGPAGDLFLEIELAPHPYFSVDGKNIILTLPVSAPEAALGATLAVPTLDGNVNLKIPPGSSSGDKLRLKGRGLGKGSEDDAPGDQLVILKVVLPKQHTSAAAALYRQLAEQEPTFDPRADLTRR